MGSDNLHHKRKGRLLQARGSRERQSSRSILIATEGKKTEPIYIDALRAHLGIVKQRVAIEHKHSDPISVVQLAIDKKEKNAAQFQDAEDRYESVFAVLDTDKHVNINEALQLAKSNNIIPIVSLPCFEFWLLLHFIDTDKPFQSTGIKSICDTVISQLKRQEGMANYEKARSVLMPNLMTRVGVACARAAKLSKAREADPNLSSYTSMFELVAKLNEMKPK
jgi:RloB-like protein